MNDKSLIGRFGPDYEMPIERGKLREFANATYAPWPAFIDDHRAVIPPTYLCSAGVFWGYTLERPRRTHLEALEHDLSVSLHAEESYIFHGEPPGAGDVLIARAGLESFTQKRGRRGGKLAFLTLLTEFRNRAGDLVAEARSVSVTSDAQGDIAASAPDYEPIDIGREPLDPFATIEQADAGAVTQGASPGRIDMAPLSIREVVRYAAAGGEDDPLHYDLVHAKAQGFPGMFGLGMHQAGGLGSYATRWLGAKRVRSMRIRFPNMFFIGDELSYEGRVTAIETINDRRMATLDLKCTRRGDGATIVEAIMQFDLGD